MWADRLRRTDCASSHKAHLGTVCSKYPYPRYGRGGDAHNPFRSSQPLSFAVSGAAAAIFNEEALEGSLRDRRIHTAAFDSGIKHRRGRPEHALDGQVRNIFFARPPHQIVRTHVEIPQLMVDIVFEPTQHTNPRTDYNHTRYRL